MTNRNTLLLASSIVAINLLIAHFFAPLGLFLIPLVLVFVTYLMMFQTTALKPTTATLITVGLLIFYDIGLTFFAGVTHDAVGKVAILIAFTYIGLAPCFVFVIIASLKNKKVHWLEKVMAIVIFPLAMVLMSVVLKQILE